MVVALGEKKLAPLVETAVRMKVKLKMQFCVKGVALAPPSFRRPDVCLVHALAQPRGVNSLRFGGAICGAGLT